MKRCLAYGIYVTLVLAAVLAILYWPCEAPPCEMERPEPKDDIDRALDRLDRELPRVLAFVRDEIAPEDYPGHLRGPLATLWSGGGNDIDRAALLAEMLRRLGLSTRFVRGRTWAVEYEDGGEWILAGPVDPEGQEATLEIPEEEFWRIRIAIRAREEIGAVTLATADLSGAPIRVGYDEQGIRIGLKQVSADLRALPRLDLEFTVLGPGGEVRLVRRRELFTREFDAYPSVFHRKNVYCIYLFPHAVPPMLAERARGDLFQEVAMGFATASDVLSRKLAAKRGVRAFPVEPRIVIVGIEHGPGRSRRISIDLVHDGVRVEGPPEAVVRFRRTRSAFDAALEGEVLSRVTGAAVVNPLALIRARLAGASDAAPSGARLLGLVRFALFEARPGTGLLFAGREKVALEAVALGKARRNGADISGTAEEIALALARAIGPSWTVSVEWPRPANPFVGTRVVMYREKDGHPAMAWVGTRRRVPEGMLAEIRDYYNELDESWTEQQTTVLVREADLAAAEVFTPWYHLGTDDASGRTWGSISRKAYQDLVRDGSTELRYLDGSTGDWPTSEPIRLHLIERRPATLEVDGVDVQVPVLVLGGDFASADPARRPLAEYPDHPDKLGGFMNKLMVLDDPEYPAIVGNVCERTGHEILTGLAGRIVCDGEAFPGARVRCGRESTFSMPDGSFWVPLAVEEEEVAVEIEDPDLEPSSTALRLADYKPGTLEIACRRKAPLFFAVDRSNAGAELAKVSARARTLILAKLEEAPATRFLVVPRCPTPIGTTTAWLETNPETGEEFARIEDGLYGSTVPIDREPLPSPGEDFEAWAGKVKGIARESVEGLPAAAIDASLARAKEIGEDLASGVLDGLAAGDEPREVIGEELGKAGDSVELHLDQLPREILIDLAREFLVEAMEKAALAELENALTEKYGAQGKAYAALAETMYRYFFRGQAEGIAFFLGYIGGGYVATGTFLDAYLDASMEESAGGRAFNLEVVMARATTEAYRFYRDTYARLPDDAMLGPMKAGILQGMQDFFEMEEEANRPPG